MKILLLGLLAMGLSLTAALLLPNYYGLAIVIVVCAVCGIFIRKEIVKMLKNKFEEYENS